MRWLYPNENDSAEQAMRDRVEQQIHDWWVEFARNTDRLEGLFRQQEEWDLPGWMEQHLQSISPALMWEFGPAVDKQGHRLVITPEHEHEQRMLAAHIVAQAPELSQWEFYTYRLPEPAEATEGTVKARVGVSLADVTVAVAISEHNRIDLTWRWPQLPADEDLAFNAAFVATETLLGERMLDRWVGLIQLTDDSDPASPGQHFLELDRLKPTFDALVDTTRSQLPDEPCGAFVDDGEWALMKLQPEEASDYPERYDMMTCLTCNPDLVGATFSNGPFYSERFSRCDEMFCYLKIDGEDAGDMGFHDREDIEEAARHALEAADAGAVIGGGTGLRYSYVELAITDMDRAVPALRRAMQEGTVPRRSWLLFHDADYGAEWIGIYDDSPAPPAGEVES